MQRVKVYGDLSTDSVDWRGLLADFSERRLTGYIKLTYWDREDYLILVEGSLKEGLRKIKGSNIVHINPSQYVPSGSGIIDVFQTTLCVVHRMRSFKDMPLSPYTFAGYGTLAFPYVKLASINLAKLLQNIRNVGLYGYAVFSTVHDIKLMVVFQDGTPILSYYDDGYNLERYQSLMLSPSEVFLEVYSTDKELPLLLYSMRTIREVKREEFKSSMAGIHVTEVDRGSRFYVFYHRSRPVLCIRSHLEGFDHLEECPPADTGTFFSMQIEYSPQPIEIRFTEPSPSSKINPGSVLELKKYFTEEIGPIGPLIWNKVLKHLGLSEESMDEESFKRLIDALYMEIPDKLHAENFLKKAKGIVL
ncbi:hypothetical protein [Thermocrinis minervae]|uniref:DUF8082 domain-containing protein n=1 Tax=Thermocrinis minervae TaxID=381751 RepID=A0A1M6RQC7_9AQUI|nr:hypothetical protein [Thermocrinis minervae]SHK34676.1 hypothetical protein SAMN05444391_0733 [Thermocrinis minervae]